MGTMFRDDDLARRIEAALVKPEKPAKRKVAKKGLLSTPKRKRKK